MGKQVLNGSFGFPNDSTLPGSNIVVPNVIVADGAFRLHTHIIKPYIKKAGRYDITKTVFNYRLSRARRVTENAFAFLSQIFRVYYQPINLKTSTTEGLIWVACYLHNMLRNGYLENIIVLFTTMKKNNQQLRITCYHYREEVGFTISKVLMSENVSNHTLIMKAPYHGNLVNS